MPPPGTRGPEGGPGTPAAPRPGELEAGSESGEGARRARHRCCPLARAGRGAGGEGGHGQLGRPERASPSTGLEPGPSSRPSSSAAWARAWGRPPPLRVPGRLLEEQQKTLLEVRRRSPGPPGVGAARSLRPGAAARPGCRCPAALGAIVQTRQQLRWCLSPGPQSLAAGDAGLLRPSRGSPGEPRRAFLVGPSGRTRQPRR